MGSLTSGPSAPTPQPEIVYVPQPVNNTPTPVVTPSASEQEQTQEEANTEIRRQNLLGRERSRFGTIQTSFRGLLGLSDNGEQRKTLLGQ